MAAIGTAGSRHNGAKPLWDSSDIYILPIGSDRHSLTVNEHVSITIDFHVCLPNPKIRGTYPWMIVRFFFHHAKHPGHDLLRALFCA